MADRDALLALLPDDPHVGRAAAKLDDETLGALLADPEVRDQLRLLTAGSKLHRLLALGFLGNRGLYEDDPDPVPEPAPDPGDPQPGGDGYTQGNPKPKRPHLVVTSIDDVAEEEERWLWPGRVPLGAPTLLLGRQGKGKSTFLGWLTATVSAGLQWPDCPDDNEPGSVLILQAEESKGRAVRRRLNAFGYGQGKVHTVDGVQHGDGSKTWFSLRHDVELLADECHRRGDVRLVVVDPLGSYIRGISGYNECECREYLQPLFKLAEDFDLAVVLAAHMNKDGEKDILDRVSGSGAFSQMVRMGWYLSEDPSDTSRRLLSLLKCNLDGATRTGIAVHYDTSRRRLTWFPDPVEMDAVTVDHLLQKQAREAKLNVKPGRAPALTRKAEEFLLAALDKGPMLQSSAQDQALNVGIKEGTFRKALRSLMNTDGRVLRHRDERDGRWWLLLGGEADPAGPEPPEGEAGDAPPDPDSPPDHPGGDPPPPGNCAPS